MPAPLDPPVPPRGATSCRAPAGGSRGASWVSVILLLALAAGGYLGWMWVPLYADHYAVKQATRDYMNRAVKNRNDAALVSGLSLAIARVRRQTVTDEQGTAWDVPAVDVPPEAILWERDTASSPPRLHVSFEYERTIVYPLTDRTTEAHFTVDLESDIGIPKWD
jgi:hypothetical protein